MNGVDFKRRVIAKRQEILADMLDYAGYTGTGDGGNYCVHGTYLGYWDGPDYLCGPCEDGISVGMYAYYAALSQVQMEMRAGKQELADKLTNAVVDLLIEYHDSLDGADRQEVLSSLWIATKTLTSKRK